MHLNLFPSKSHFLDTMASLRLIMPEALEREREIAHEKWFAYRFLSPLAATKLFAAHYTAGYKAYVRLHGDVEKAKNVMGLGARIFSNPGGSLTELWNARQRADQLRLPYDLLIEFGFWFAGRRTWKHAPRPAQLFGSKESTVAWPLEIEKWLEERLPTAVHRLDDIQQYKIENYRGFASQDDFRAHLLEVMTETAEPWTAKVERQCLARRHLPISIAFKAVPKGARQAVARHLRSEIHRYPTVAPAATLADPALALAPACFGLPHSRSEIDHRCITCPLAANCRNAVDHVTALTLHRTGSTSPVADQRKKSRNKKTAARVRSFRARQALIPAGAVT